MVGLLFCFLQAGGSLDSLESLASLENLKRPLFRKTPLSEPDVMVYETPKGPIGRRLTIF